MVKKNYIYNAIYRWDSNINIICTQNQKIKKVIYPHALRYNIILALSKTWIHIVWTIKCTGTASIM